MALSTNQPTPANSNGRYINGRGLGRRRLDDLQRLELAAGVVSGRIPFKPSYQQASVLFGVSSAAVGAAVKYRATRDAITAIVTAWNAATPEEREVAVRTIGVADIWDVIASVIA